MFFDRKEVDFVDYVPKSSIINSLGSYYELKEDMAQKIKSTNIDCTKNYIILHATLLLFPTMKRLMKLGEKFKMTSPVM